MELCRKSLTKLEEQTNPPLKSINGTLFCFWLYSWKVLLIHGRKYYFQSNIRMSKFWLEKKVAEEIWSHFLLEIKIVAVVKIMQISCEINLCWGNVGTVQNKTDGQSLSQWKTLVPLSREIHLKNKHNLFCTLY